MIFSQNQGEVDRCSTPHPKFRGVETPPPTPPVWRPWSCVVVWCDVLCCCGVMYVVWGTNVVVVLWYGVLLVYFMCCVVRGGGGGGWGAKLFFEFGRVACREVREIRGMFHEKYFLNCAIWGDLQYIFIKFWHRKFQKYHFLDMIIPYYARANAAINVAT